MTKKRLERWYVEQLERAVPDFPTGTMQDDETPDFIVLSDGRTIGIEVTVFHWPPDDMKRPHQEEQALKDRVVAVADRVHAEAGGPGLYVTVFFATTISFRKRDISERGEAIARAVLDTAAPASLDDPAGSVPWDRLPSGISAITIRARVDGRDRLWSADAGGWVAPVHPAHIEAVVERKTAMASCARAKCDELWLAVVNDEFSRAAPWSCLRNVARLSTTIRSTVFSGSSRTDSARGSSGRLTGRCSRRAARQLQEDSNSRERRSRLSGKTLGRHG